MSSHDESDGFGEGEESEIVEELLTRTQSATTLDEAGAVLADVQLKFGFHSYYVLEMARLNEREPISFLYPSNIAAALFTKCDECLTDFGTQLFMQSPGTFGPIRWDLEESLSQGFVTQEAADFFRLHDMTMGMSFPTLGSGGSPRLIGFSGGRAHLSQEEIDTLHLLMIHMHERLNILARTRGGEHEPLSEMEKQCLFMAADGDGFEAISKRMSLSRRTIQFLVDAICRKMEVATMEHAVAIALRRRLIV